MVVRKEFNPPPVDITAGGPLLYFLFCISPYIQHGCSELILHFGNVVFIKEGMVKGRFYFENESFEQIEEIQENKYGVNIPMCCYYKMKFRKGWVCTSNPLRGTWVVRTPDSDKTFSIIGAFIRQHSAKGFAMVVYDYKFPTLATKLFYHHKLNEELGRVPKGCTFNMINLVDLEYRRRVIHKTPTTWRQPVKRRKRPVFPDIRDELPGSRIYFFVIYELETYGKDVNMLHAEKRQDP